MRLVEQSVEYLRQEDGLEGVYKQIERAARVCYKSEDRITEDSAKKFVEAMKTKGHTSTLEHGTVYLAFPTKVIDDWHRGNEPELQELAREEVIKSPYSKVFAGGHFITTNMRVIHEVSRGELLLSYMVPPMKGLHERRHTVKIITNRAIANELVRHRVFSFSQESTRYCNYTKDKFGNEVSFISPQDYLMEQAYQQCEDTYFALVNKGMKPEIARDVLPLGLKTEIVMTGFESDWVKFFALRTGDNVEGKAGRPHPMMQDLAKMIRDTINAEGK